MGSCAVDVTADEVVVGLGASMKVWALSRGPRIALRDVTEAAAVRRQDIERKARIRVAGTALPGVVSAGRFWRRGWWEFWAVRRADPLLVIRCGPDARYDRVVLETADPAADAARITAALS